MRKDESEEDLKYIFQKLGSEPEVYNKYAQMYLSYKPAKLGAPKPQTFCGLKSGFLNRPSQPENLRAGNFYHKQLHELSEELNTSCCYSS